LVDAFVAAQQSQADCTDTSGEISTEVDGLAWDTMLGPVVIHAMGIILAFLSAAGPSSKLAPATRRCPSARRAGALATTSPLQVVRAALRWP
jgi:hypothetical protein